MKTVLFAILIISSLSALSQAADEIWYFGNFAGISFVSGTPVIKAGSAMQSLDNTSTITDGSGALVFYTNGINVWDRNNSIMPNGTNLGSNASSGQSAVIVPQPLTNNYYIFNIGIAPLGTFQYSIVDISLNNGNGSVISKSNILLTGITEKIDAIYNPNDTSYWIMTHDWNNNQFKCYKLDSNGLNSTPIISAIGSVHSGGNPSGYNAVGQMSFSEDGSKLANVIYSDGKIEVFDFNVLTGTLSNSISISGFTNCWGVSISQNNHFLYFTEWYYDKIWQFDISSGNASTIASSKTLVGTSTFPTGTSNYKIGYLQNAPDGKIYAAKFDQHYISAITNPNSQGLNCGFIDNAVFLGNSKVCKAGLSRTVQSYGWLNKCKNKYFLSHYICKGDSILIEGSYYKSAQTVIKTFSDINGCDSIRVDSLILNQLPSVFLGNDTSFCNGDSILLMVQPSYSTLWSTGIISDSIFITTSGIYWVRINDSICSNTDTISISNLSHAFININDTSICDGDILSISLAPQNTYLWSFGSTNSNIELRDSGIYFVEITDLCKQYTDSFNLKTKECNCPIFIPNVFTPNGDGINDSFFPVIECELDYYHMYIFNRWGKLIFESTNQYEVWDGKYENRYVPDGVYFYLMESTYLYLSQKKQLQTGSVTIFR